MKISLVIPVSLGFFCFFLLATIAHGEIVDAESIEWILATSDRVLVGKVVKVAPVADQEKNERRPVTTVTVAVSKTLKGEHAEHEIIPNISENFAKQWMDEGIPIVFCLVKNDGKRVSIPVEKFPWVLREDGDAILLGRSKHYWTGCIRVLTCDFEVLTETDTILKFLEKNVKAVARNTPPRSHEVKVPFDTAVFEKLSCRSAVFLIAPVDDRLEALGQKWCTKGSPRLRMEGAKILPHFKNQKNIEILLSLLNDPNTVESTFHRKVPWKTDCEMEMVYRKKEYYVRQAAFDALRELGVRIDRPVLEELLEDGPR